jgi:hypothetical protein
MTFTETVRNNRGFLSALEQERTLRFDSLEAFQAFLTERGYRRVGARRNDPNLIQWRAGPSDPHPGELTYSLQSGG